MKQAENLIVTDEYLLRQGLLVGMLIAQISKLTGIPVESITISVTREVENRLQLLSPQQKQAMFAELILHMPKSAR